MKNKVCLILITVLFLTIGVINIVADVTLQSQNISVAKKVFEHFNQHNWEKMAELYSDSAEFLDPSFGQKPIKQTRRQTVKKYQEMQAIFKDIRDDVVQIYASGDKNVIVEFVSSGTAPDGTKWTLPICTIFTIENGQITKDHTYYDNQSEK